MTTRTIKIGFSSFEDHTPRTIFPSNVAEFGYKPLEKQVLDLPKYSVDVKKTEFNDKDFELTIAIRSRMKELTRKFPSMRKLTKIGMLAAEDQAAFPLPLDHDPSLPDWLTYHHPVYQAFMLDLARELSKKFDNDEVQDACGKLLTDYSYNVPYASCIHHDGQYSVDDSILPRGVLEEFRKQIEPYLAAEIRNADIEACKCPLNVTKGVGFNCLWPDGRLYSKAQSFFVPKTLYTEIPNNLFRYDNEAFKLAWYESGRLIGNLEYFLQTCSSKDMTSRQLIDYLLRECLSVHTEAYRSNQPDSVIFNSDRIAYEGCHTKDRFYSYEDYKNPCTFISGKLDNAKWTEAYRKLNPEAKGPGLRKRPIYPAPNASFSANFIVLCRLIMHRVESLVTAFPSNRPEFFARYERFISDHSDDYRTMFSFDRSNSEQFITDNWDKYIHTAMPKWLEPVIHTLGTAVVPSVCGPRVFSGGLPSGTAQTTFLNWFTGMITCSIVICKVAYMNRWQVNYPDVLRDYLQMIFTGGDGLTFNGLSFLTQSGTDDQSMMIAGDERRIKDGLTFVTSDFESQKLSFEQGDQITAFGLDMNINSIAVSQTLGLTKLFLMEHTKNGDAAAAKLVARLQLLPDYYGIIADKFREYGFGSLASYESGATRFFENLVEFGYPVEGFYNEFSPVENLIMSAELEKRGIDPRTSRKSYPDSFTQESKDLFIKYFGIGGK